MNSPGTTLINPLSKPNYSNLRNSTDPTAQSIVTNFTTIYNNISTIASLEDNTNDVNTLDTVSINIEKAYDNILNIAKPCISNTDTNKCTTSASCMLLSDIEILNIDFIILLSDVIPVKGIKNNYEFIGFFMQKKFSDLVTNNKSNYDSSNKIYLLCQKSTTSPITYTPRSDDPKLEAAYAAVNNRMASQLSNRDERVQTSNLMQILLYIILPAVLIILAYLGYVAYMRAHTVTQVAPIESTTVVPTVTTSEAVPIAPIVTSEAVPITPTVTSETENKTGGHNNSLLNYLPLGFY